jgi:hypothetical protein
MKKTEQIFKELAEKDFTLTTNPKELTEEDYWSVLEQAMQETAVQFLDWREKRGYIKHDNGMYYSPPYSTDAMINAIYGNQEFFTTAELFEIFNNDK